jgi:hypothetical protein
MHVYISLTMVSSRPMLMKKSKVKLIFVAKPYFFTEKRKLVIYRSIICVLVTILILHQLVVMPFAFPLSYKK